MSQTDTPEIDHDLYDVTIIGGGPVGLFGSFYAGLRGMKTKIIDSLPELGGQLSTLYPEKYVYDMPGFPKVIARDLANSLIEQGTRFDPTVVLNERVENIHHLPDETIRLDTGSAVHRTKTVIICAGQGAFAPKKLEAPGADIYEDNGLHYFVKNKMHFADKRLLIIGGGDSALDWCMNLEPIADKITLAHRRDVFRAHEESVDWLFNRSQVETRLFYEIKHLEGNGVLQRAVLLNSKTKEELALDVDAVLVNIGFNASIGPIREWGVELGGKGGSKIVVNERMETNLPGVYSAGDICTHEGKLDLIATGVGEVCIAVNYAKVRTDPSAKAFPGHSSNMSL